MAENLQHEDFGEKIGGAKKDLWKDRGLYVDDLGAMNEREAEKFVKKDNVWKKPDYQAMLDDGVPLGVVYFIKKARDSLGASPQYRYSDKTPELRRARQEEYIETVRQLQAVIEDVRTLDDAMQAYDRFLIQNGYVEQVQGWASGTHYRATKKSLDNPVITNKLVQALHIRSASHFDRDFTQKAQQEQFGVSKDQKMPKGYAIHFNDGKNTYSRNNDWKLADNTVPHALGVDHRRTQGVFHRSVFFNALGQHDELFLQIIILGSQVVHCLGDLLEIIIHILTAIALERFVKCDVADILGRDHDGFPPVCGAHGPVIPCPQRCGRSCAQYW